MSSISFRQFCKRSPLLLLLGLLLFPTEAFSLQVNPQASIRQTARANYLQAMGESWQDLSGELTLENIAEETSSPPQAQQSFSLNELLRQVARDNQQVLIQKTEWGIRQSEAESSHAIFEPELVTAFSLEEQNQRNSVEESLSRQLTSTYSQNNWTYDLSLQGLAPTGGKFKLGYNLNKLSNSLTRSLTGEDEEYQMSLGLNLRQPLLKNAGVKTTKTGIIAAELESQAAFQQYRLELMQRIGKASVAYWDYYQTQEQLNLRQDSLRIAQQIATDSRERLRTGKMAESEVLEAKIGVNSRAALLSEAEHLKRQVTNRLRNLLSIKSSSEELNLRLTDSPKTGLLVLNADEMVRLALKLRPEYLAAREKLKQGDIKIAFAKNQSRPELDLLASYGLNGLDFSADDSWQQIQDTDYTAWSLGLEFRVPLGGGISSRSELKKAQFEKSRQLLVTKDIEIELANRIDTALDNVTRGAEQLQYAEQNTEIQRQLLESEMARLKAGKSSSRQVLEKEENYRSARETALKNQIKLQTAHVELELAGGTILKNHGVDIMETKM